MYLLDNSNFQTALYFNWFYMSTLLNMVEMIFVENVYFSGLGVLQSDWKMHLQHMQMHELGMLFLLQLEFATNSGDNAHVCTCLVQACCTREKLEEREREKAQQVQWQVAVSNFTLVVLRCVREQGESEVK